MLHNADVVGAEVIPTAYRNPALHKRVTGGIQYDENLVTKAVEEYRIPETTRFFNLFKGIDLSMPSTPGNKFNNRFNPFRYAGGGLDALRAMPLDILRSNMVLRINVYDRDNGAQLAGYEVPRAALKTFKEFLNYLRHRNVSNKATMMAGPARIPLFLTPNDYTNYIQSEHDLVVVDPEFVQPMVPCPVDVLALMDVNTKEASKAVLRTKINDMRNARKKGQMYPGTSGWAKDAPWEEFLPRKDIWGEHAFVDAAQYAKNLVGFSE